MIDSGLIFMFMGISQNGRVYLIASLELLTGVKFLIFRPVWIWLKLETNCENNLSGVNLSIMTSLLYGAGTNVAYLTQIPEQ